MLKNKDSKKFLLIANGFPPINDQNSLRALEFSKRLVKADIEPIILTRRITRREPKDYNLMKQVPKSLKIFRTPIIELKKKYSLRTLLFKVISKILSLYLYSHWIPFGYWFGKKIIRENKGIKFIYSSGPPFQSNIIGYLLKRKFKIPLIVEYRDPWSFNPYAKKSKFNLDRKIIRFIEKKIIYSTDKVIAISEALRLQLIQSFPELNKKPTYTIENGLNLEKKSFDIKIDKSKIILTFIGKLYGKRNVFPLLKIISELNKEQFFEEIKFKFKIFGMYDKSRFIKQINSLNIQNLVFLGEFLNRNQLIEEIFKSTVTVHIGEDLNYPTISFKVWDYLSCGKKILYLGREDSFTADFLIKNNLGIVLPINDNKRGKSILRDLLHKIEKNQFKTKVDENTLNQFTWDSKVNKFKLAIQDFL